MRHLVGLLLAIVLAAAVFFAASWGYLKLLIGPARLGTLPAGGGSLLHDHAVLEGIGVLLGVGLITGLLIAAPRISPLAAGLPGLVLLAWTGLYLFSVRRAVHYIPLKTRPYGTGFEAMLFDGGAGPDRHGHDHPAVHSVPVAAQARGDRARLLPGQHGELPRPAGHPDHARRQRPAVRLDPDQAAAAGGPEQPRRPQSSPGPLGTRRIRLILPSAGPAATFRAARGSYRRGFPVPP
jgi:hypothetical protein